MSGNGGPSEDDISLFCDIITGLTRAEAIKRLRANNNDLQRATEEYFENPQSTKYKWDESQFSADREGDFNSASVSFNIQGPDELAPTSYHGSTAPTRPPSRANNLSPLGRLTEWTAQEAAVEGAPTNHAEENAALQRALAESAAESGIPPQESGIVETGSTAKYFGPANRTEYDSTKWAMVPTNTTTEVTNTDPKPSTRKRQLGTPAFIRQIKDCRLGSLLSIYHKIPVFRNILLNYPSPARTYGHNSEWWKGQPILKPEVLAAMMRGETVSDEDSRPAFSEELHRLMAFLDRTNRSYATVDALTETTPIDPSGGRNSWGVDYESMFLDHFIDKNRTSPEFDIAPIISIGQQVVPTSSSTTNESSDDSESFEGEQGATSFALIDLPLVADQYAWINSLYDALDELLWTNAISAEQAPPENGGSTAVLVRPAEVLTIRFNGAGLQKPCEMPAIFYADRYMESRQDLAQHFQRQIHEIRRNGLRKLARWEEHRSLCKGEPGCSKFVWLGPSHGLRPCRQKIIETFEVLVEQQRRNAQWRYYEERWRQGIPYSMNDLRMISTWSGLYRLTPEEEARQERWERMIQAAKDDLEELDQDMKVCHAKREQFLDGLDVISKRLTCQEHEVDDERFVYSSNPQAYRPDYWNPSQKYLLRGVSLTSELFYVCIRGEPDLIDMGEGSKPDDQWWKIEYSANSPSSAKIEKAPLDDVLSAAGTGSRYPILVYATEKAIETTPIPLSDPLRMFVKADNRSFQQELTQEQNLEQTHQEPPPAPTAITDDTLSRIPVSSPAKRKHSASSSVATNGSSRGGLDDVELTFSDDNNVFGEDNGPSASHQEFVNNSPQSSKMGGLVESLANFQTDEQSFDKRLDERILETANEGAEAKKDATSKAPEMQERAGGPAPFFNSRAAGDSNTSGGTGTIDMMDMDLDSDHPDSRP